MALSVIFLCVCSGSLHTAIYSGNLLTNYLNSILITHSVERALLTEFHIKRTIGYFFSVVVLFNRKAIYRDHHL